MTDEGRTGNRQRDAATLVIAAGALAASYWLWRRERRGEVETDRRTAARLGARP